MRGCATIDGSTHDTDVQRLSESSADETTAAQCSEWRDCRIRIEAEIVPYAVAKVSSEAEYTIDQLLMLSLHALLPSCRSSTGEEGRRETMSECRASESPESPELGRSTFDSRPEPRATSDLATSLLSLCLLSRCAARAYSTTDSSSLELVLPLLLSSAAAMSSIRYEDEAKDVKVKRERSSSAAVSFHKPPPRQPKIEIVELKVRQAAVRLFGVAAVLVFACIRSVVSPSSCPTAGCVARVVAGRQHQVRAKQHGRQRRQLS